MEDFLSQVKDQNLPFTEIIQYIENNYKVIPTAFQNGDAYNSETQNQGSAKVLYFAKLLNLSKEDTLLLFAEHYQSVLADPEGDNHQNIRQFMKNGWEGVRFESIVLEKK
jgi:hypothetical protein